MRDSDFDPRAWNLVVGAAMLAGCGARPLPGDDGETSGTTEDESGSEDTTGSDSTETDSTETDSTETDSTETDSTETNDDDEYGCRTDADCTGVGYYGTYECHNGYCAPVWDCLWDYHCDVFELCEQEECVSQGTSPPSCGFDEFAVPTIHVLEDSPLALSFVDVDVDSQDELVVATATELAVYEFGSNVPTITVREVPSLDQTSMVAGNFDDQPGEDIVLLVQDEYQRYFSDGVAGWMPPIVEASPLPGASSLFAVDFDGQTPTDLVVWGASGATMDFTGTTVLLTHELVTDVAGFDYGSTAAGLALVRGYQIWIYDFMGNGQAGIDPMRAVMSLHALDEPHYVTGRGYEANNDYWWELHVRQATNFASQSTIFLPGDYTFRAAADFDGDQYDELFTAHYYYGGLLATVIFDVFTEPCIATQDLDIVWISDLAVGDHDGDGDDEVALIFEDFPSVKIFDVE